MLLFVLGLPIQGIATPPQSHHRDRYETDTRPTTDRSKLRHPHRPQMVENWSVSRRFIIGLYTSVIIITPVYARHIEFCLLLVCFVSVTGSLGYYDFFFITLLEIRHQNIMYYLCMRDGWRYLYFSRFLLKVLLYIFPSFILNDISCLKYSKIINGNWLSLLNRTAAFKYSIIEF